MSTRASFEQNGDVPTYLVRFVTTHGERVFRIRDGGTLLAAALRARLPVARSCRGEGLCAACRMRILDGAQHVAAPSPAERQLAARYPLSPHERYACLARVHGECTVTTTYW
jgi:2Fe-2S ferredoxin